MVLSCTYTNTDTNRQSYIHEYCWPICKPGQFNVNLTLILMQSQVLVCLRMWSHLSIFSWRHILKLDRITPWRWRTDVITFINSCYASLKHSCHWIPMHWRFLFELPVIGRYTINIFKATIDFGSWTIIWIFYYYIFLVLASSQSPGVNVMKGNSLITEVAL